MSSLHIHSSFDTALTGSQLVDLLIMRAAESASHPPFEHTDLKRCNTAPHIAPALKQSTCERKIHMVHDRKMGRFAFAGVCCRPIPHESFANPAFASRDFFFRREASAYQCWPNHHYWPTTCAYHHNSAHQLPTWPTVLPNMGCKAGPGPRPAS